MLRIIVIVILVLIILFLLRLHKMNAKKQKLHLAAQKLWMDHMLYTREYLLRYINKLPAVDETATRLLKNQDDLAHTFNLVYPGSYEPIKKLLTDHIMIATKLVDAIVNKTGQDALYSSQWNQNATDIANALAELNKKYDVKVLNDMMQMHLKTTSEELKQLLDGKSGIPEFDAAVNHMMHFNDYLFQ